MQTTELIERRAAYLTKHIEEQSSKLAEFPKGKLRSYPQQKHYKYFICYEDRKRRYLPKSNPALIQTMANKKMIEADLHDSRAELKACEHFLHTLKAHPADAMDHLLRDKGICKVLPKSYGMEDVDAWIHEAYKSNPAHPEHLNVPTITGEMVRSKSEAMFVQLIYTMGIPYRYEQLLQLDDFTYYPDFTLLRPRDQKIFIVELFGMMDVTRYAIHTCEKLHVYTVNGYIPDDNLLCFFETSEHPLDISYVKTKLDLYLK